MEPVHHDDATPSYLRAPFYDPADYDPVAYQRALRWLLADPPPRKPAYVPPPPPQLTEQDQAALCEWEQRGFTDVDRDTWIAAGLSRYHAHIADQCQRWGIQPAQLMVIIDGRRVAERLRSGESVTSVWALLQRAVS